MQDDATRRSRLGVRLFQFAEPYLGCARDSSNALVRFLALAVIGRGLLMHGKRNAGPNYLWLVV